jgi:hypothetical protein
MKNIFTEHPQSVGETYFQHLKFASVFGGKMVIGGLACIIHAIFPFFFEKTGSNILLQMMQDFVERMPSVDDRVRDISRVIEKKIANPKVTSSK